MGLPGHRRTSSDKRRRAAHFALKPATLAVDKETKLTHLPHRAAPNAPSYNGIAIHRKGADKKVQKMLAKTKSKATSTEEHDHDHDHAGPGHTHDHS